MISFLTPTRKRPDMLLNFMTSVLETAHDPQEIEFVLYVDNDDDSYDAFKDFGYVKFKKGPRKNLSACYEWKRGEGPIYAMGGDDVIFRTRNWDTLVYEAFQKHKDKILLVYGRDGDPTHDDVHGTHPFIHRNWIEATGRYLPSYFSGDFPDTWLNDLADGVGRKIMVNMYTEHMHPAFGKREKDQTDNERWEKHFLDDMPQKYLDTLPERLEDIRKLKKFIKEFK